MVERESTALLPAAGNRNLFQRRATATSGGDSFHPWSTPHCAGLPSPPYLAFLPQEVRARDQPPFACLRSLASVRGLRGGCLLAASRPSALTDKARDMTVVASSRAARLPPESAHCVRRVVECAVSVGILRSVTS